MRPYHFVSIALIPISLALLLPGTAAHAATAQRTQAELKALNQKIDRMTQRVSQDALERERHSADLKAAEVSLGQARGELNRLNRDYAERTARRAGLAQARDGEQHSLDAERTALAGQLRAAYMLGREEPLKLLLNQQDPLHSSRLYTYYSYFGRARARQIGVIEQRVQHLDELDAQLAQEQTQITELKSAQQSQLALLQQARDRRQTVLVSFNAAAQTHEQNLARLKTQQEDLERLLDRLNQTLKSVPPPENGTAFGRSRGQLNWPVAGHLTARFGAQRASGVNWEGVVIATEHGSPVSAVASGRVVYADWLPGLGLLVIIDHGDGYMSLYGHNDRLLKAVGESVSAGETIAAAGDSGGRASPELYFEIRRGGKPVDPAPWFKTAHP
ncbi:MAG TPA: peptidoglycan DD-metalloendopeptidase family protein [Steroidobacteraceae bacterium]|jgi:septal ring factor EnvC (AmiA/AmiB activator)|nr:peptidoglycan DD-metalloendopeptidase family protein [Steroidobacteraceae bacterium]